MVRLYLDSFERDRWEDLLPTGLFYGITTNPLLAMRAGLSYDKIDWQEISATADKFHMRELHIQLPEVDASVWDFVKHITEACKTSECEIIIKIPLTEAGIRIAPQIQAHGFRILMTACYHAKQMFVAKALGAAYIAPYYGRMVEAGIEARQHLRTMRAIPNASEAPCRLLIASIRSTDQMLELAADGHDIFTIGPDVAMALLSDAHSEAAAEEFSKAARHKN